MNKIAALPKFPHQFFYFIAQKIRRMLLKISGMLVTPPMAVYEKAQGLWISRAIVAACELNIADHLLKGPKHISELATLSNANQDALYRLMRTLAGEGVFKELPGKYFRNNRQSTALAEGDQSMKYMIMQQFGQNNLLLFSELTNCIRSGESNAEKLLGMKGFEYLEANPEKNEIYNKAMDNSSELLAMVLLSSYNFKGINTLVDVGGGHGVLLTAILAKYPGMKGILFDQDHVVDKARKTVENPSPKEFLEIISGDFFHDMPDNGDAYLMKNILHAFSDDDCLKILKKLHAVMPSHGKLIVIEAIIKPDNRPSLGKLIDLLMMTGTEGGKERTAEEFENLLQASGFQVSAMTRTIAPFSIIEALKK